ncbi:MAG: oxidoreductase [Lachnospiraceae bacterium]|nr:oxidoreductase [Lachnospiraceae bacterium]
MARLSLWIPPFSPDYSGAAAVLFDLKTVTAMHDGSGCTGNYTSYDEPRWYGSKAGIFCSGLRRIDAILGDDEKLMKKMTAAAADLKPDILALIGSPVPMVIGADLKGIAAELEERTGLPSFGFDTTGTAYYDQGAYLAGTALMDRFTKPPKSGRQTDRHQVNILGALPMDFGNGENVEALREILEKNGWEIGLTFAMGYTLDELANAAEADVNLAVSRFGYRMAVYMEQKFDIPFVCGFPAGELQEKRLLAALQKTAEMGTSTVLKDRCPGAAHEKVSEGKKETFLILGEEVMANAIRNVLEEHFTGCNAVVGCLFGREQALARDCDLELKTERQIKEAMNSDEYKTVIADPFLEPLLEEGSKKSFMPLAQYAVSSKLGEQEAAVLAGGRFEQWFKKGKIRRMKQ